MKRSLAMMTRLPSFMRACSISCALSLHRGLYAQATSMLSRTRHPLWTSAPCLDMDIDHFDMDRSKFNKFAESLFERRGIANATLDTLRLHSFAIYAANYSNRSCYQV
ncbi:F-box protein [Hordeum vulgare]|uniref:Predicted protein n=1 Tax=Hordeum vulgare subsp. vulgare TaxID=112509 RepID=F2CV34_HORVV|nr:F-box protein [Hordeum vulgare]BAJ86705.1 predicted protein [Hordeum vulgare subsp. vulgare]